MLLILYLTVDNILLQGDFSFSVMIFLNVGFRNFMEMY